MSDKKIIAVLGATGAQGGGLVRAILADKSGPFKPRALTRNVNSEKAKALAAAGAEVVAADVDDPATLRGGFQGAHGAFCVTFFWDHFSPEKEYAEAGSMADAAKQAGVEHVIWSTLDDTRKLVPLSDDRMPTLMGKYKVPHFDAKGEADALFTRAGVPTTFLQTVFYWENMIYFGAGPKRGPDGTLALVMPMGDKKLPAIASEDIGKCALGIFKRGREFIGKTVGIAGEHLSGSEMAAALTRALGEKVVYQDVPPEVYRSFGFPGADDMGNMFQFKRDFSEYYCGSRSVELARSLNPELQSFEQWLALNGSKIPVEAPQSS
ncbi:MAG TPA: NmrA/HSCARG family protein [Gemmatimonadales bacterium]|nr:NmrA/HSCARG family protein [Gemmatimonadales bacterium]